MINLNNVNLQYENTATLALENVNLKIQPKEFVVILGASGCGKTSLLNLIAGFLFTDNGDITINDHQVKGPGLDRGVVFQKNALMPWLNVEENIGFGLKLRGVSKEERTKEITKVLEWVDLTEFRNNYVYELSGGMQQRVGIARALVANPEILLMDEPLGALDAITRQDIQKVVLSLWQKTQKTILMITHSIEEALFMANKLIIMTPRPGKIHKTYDVDFSKQYLEGVDAGEIKRSQKFVNLKNEILEIIEATS
ncbi:ATP-binding cassette domain-containing protein [Bacteriovoracaceae bacterium]|nr:ATP-binding cassette domain-containing protein [Bacteriovoracaceae bacterium]